MSLVAREVSGPDDADALLASAIERARRSTFYSGHLAGFSVSGVEDLGRLPLTFRHHIQAASPYGLLTVKPSEAWHYHESSGTTGEPISAWCGLKELGLLAEMLARMVPELSEEAMLLNRFPLFAPAAFIFEEALKLTKGCHIAAGNMTWDMPFRRALGFIERLGVTALACLPLEPILLAELGDEEGLDLRRAGASLRVIFCGGAVLPPSLRRLIKKDWGARVIELYGSNEAMGLGLSCTAGRLHLCSDMLHMEVLHPTTFQPVEPGSAGILTVTSLVHEVMPLVRYFTGDLVRVSSAPCSCGDTRPTAEVLGRVEDTIELNGRQLYQFDLLDALYDFAAALDTRIFFVVVTNAGLRVRIESSPSKQASSGEAERRLRERLGVPVTIEHLAHNDVLDRNALTRTPKIYKPSLVTDWRKERRHCLTIMEALLEWPTFDGPAIRAILRRQVVNAYKRRKLDRESARQAPIDLDGRQRQRD